MLIQISGIAPGTFNEIVSGLDLFNTVVGYRTRTPDDGVSTYEQMDIMPYLRGEQTGVVHQTIVFRNR